MKREDLLYGPDRYAYVDRENFHTISHKPPELNLPTKRVFWGSKELDVPILKDPFGQMIEVINTEGCNLHMDSWHRCATTHCLAGWLVHLAGAQGYKLEVGTYTATAALEMLKAATTIPDEACFIDSEYRTVPYFFFWTNAPKEGILDALEDMRQGDFSGIRRGYADTRYAEKYPPIYEDEDEDATYD
jgi:hypothetical protein